MEADMDMTLPVPLCGVSRSDGAPCEAERGHYGGHEWPAVKFTAPAAVLRPAYRYAMRLSPRGVIDGDTIDADVDLGFSVWVRVRIRLLGWSCPELREPLGLTAKQATEQILMAAPQIIVETVKDEQTFARWLGRIWVIDQELGALLEAQGLATRSVL